jgi:hypothetical protein
MLTVDSTRTCDSSWPSVTRRQGLLHAAAALSVVSGCAALSLACWQRPPALLLLVLIPRSVSPITRSELPARPHQVPVPFAALEPAIGPQAAPGQAFSGTALPTGRAFSRQSPVDFRDTGNWRLRRVGSRLGPAPTIRGRRAQVAFFFPHSPTRRGPQRVAAFSVRGRGANSGDLGPHAPAILSGLDSHSVSCAGTDAAKQEGP